jgi:endonuclease/exonuclease/phosphatase family metal-dependent hydrolase
MLNDVETFFRSLRRWLSRSEWLIRLLGLTKTPAGPGQRGLVLIQMDGLSRHQLERAMARGRLPFLKQLRRRQKYELHSLYSGLPSSTPGMTAELLYGVKGAVPAFSFYNRPSRTLFRMFEPRSAREIDRRLRAQGPPLLAGGSAYAGIYTGGAAEIHFCAATMVLDDLFRRKYPLRLFVILLLSPYSVVRVVALIVVELLLAVFDCIRGLIAGQDLWKELKFIPSRAGVSILMRELATIGAKIDVTRGLPVVYVDMVGYDEQAHRRGPGSRFAQWSLKGIDRAIGRIWRTALRSWQRDYDVWVFSDHGSEDVVPFLQLNGRTLEQAVAEVLDGTVRTLVVERDQAAAPRRKIGSYPAGRSDFRPGLMLRRLPSEPLVEYPTPVVAAMGTVAHLYIDRMLPERERNHLGRSLVEQAGVPMVSVRLDEDRVRLWTRAGEFTLPDDAARVFAPHHPFLEEMTRDFLTLCRHPDAGDFVLWGWSRDGPYCTFPSENGSHAGPGLEETHAFALLPDDAPLALGTRSYLRPLDLRHAALRYLGREASRPAPVAPAEVDRDTLRVLTYNVHSCVGIDGRLAPQRVARVISRYQPDVVALQEVDVGHRRTGRTDQARLLAEYLRMDYHFHRALAWEGEAYGDCVLSRLPMRLVKADKLPTLPGRGEREPRGALWVTLDLNGRAIQMINTHLGLSARERLLQVRALLGEEWLGASTEGGPVVFCGDLNAGPQSAVWRWCARTLLDIQMGVPDHSPRRTWFGRHPIARIDHIFVNASFRVLYVDVGDDYLARTASDHRPLFAELGIRD